MELQDFTEPSVWRGCNQHDILEPNRVTEMTPRVTRVKAYQSNCAYTTHRTSPSPISAAAKLAADACGMLQILMRFLLLDCNDADLLALEKLSCSVDLRFLRRQLQ